MTLAGAKVFRGFFLVLRGRREEKQKTIAPGGQPIRIKRTTKEGKLEVYA